MQGLGVRRRFQHLTMPDGHPWSGPNSAAFSRVVEADLPESYLRRPIIHDVSSLSATATAGVIAAGLNQLGLHRPDSRLSPVVHAEFAQQILDVLFHGLDADLQ